MWKKRSRLKEESPEKEAEQIPTVFECHVENPGFYFVSTVETKQAVESEKCQNWNLKYHAQGGKSKRERQLMNNVTHMWNMNH